MGNNFTDIATTDPVIAATINNALDQLDGAILGGPGVADNTLKAWATAEAFELTAATWGGDGVLDSATVKWPDGSAGTLTVTSTNATWLAVDAFTVTHADSGKTVTQSAVTRNSNGNITTKPAVTVA
jgi:hypothetical protein